MLGRLWGFPGFEVFGVCMILGTWCSWGFWVLLVASVTMDLRNLAVVVCLLLWGSLYWYSRKHYLWVIVVIRAFGVGLGFGLGLIVVCRFWVWVCFAALLLLIWIWILALSWLWFDFDAVGLVN